MPARVVRELWARGAGWPRAEHWTGPVDVVHALNYVAPPARAAVIVAVHDLTFVRFPELCTPDTLRYRGLISRAVARGALVQTGSEFVADEIRAELGVPADRVVAIPWGIGAVADGRPESGARLAGSDRYVLALGTIEPRKNLPALVRAFDAVAASRSGRAARRRRPRRLGPGALRRRRRRVEVRRADRPPRLRHRRAARATSSPAQPSSPTRPSTRASGSLRSRRWLRGRPCSRPRGLAPRGARRRRGARRPARRRRDRERARPAARRAGDARRARRPRPGARGPLLVEPRPPSASPTSTGPSHEGRAARRPAASRRSRAGSVATSTG